MERSRRSFLKTAGLTALGLSVVPATRLLAAPPAFVDPDAGNIIRHPEEVTAKQWAMVIDMRQFKSAADYQPIIDACHKEHNIPTFTNPRHEIKWIWAEPYKHAFPDQLNPFIDQRTKELPFLVLCNQCENPPCVRACPTQATFKRPDGIIEMDYHRCIGCRFCMAACPYGSRSFNYRDPRPFVKDINKKYPTRVRGVVEKCNFCSHRLVEGRPPACVEAAKGAILFGDLYDPESDVRKALKKNFSFRRKQGLGTEPAVYYII